MSLLSRFVRERLKKTFTSVMSACAVVSTGSCWILAVTLLLFLSLANADEGSTVTTRLELEFMREMRCPACVLLATEIVKQYNVENSNPNDAITRTQLENIIFTAQKHARDHYRWVSLASPSEQKNAGPAGKEGDDTDPPQPTPFTGSYWSVDAMEERQVFETDVISDLRDRARDIRNTYRGFDNFLEEGILELNEELVESLVQSRSNFTVVVAKLCFLSLRRGYRLPSTGGTLSGGYCAMEQLQLNIPILSVGIEEGHPATSVASRQLDALRDQAAANGGFVAMLLPQLEQAGQVVFGNGGAALHDVLSDIADYVDRAVAAGAVGRQKPPRSTSSNDEPEEELPGYDGPMPPRDAAEEDQKKARLEASAKRRARLRLRRSTKYRSVPRRGDRRKASQRRRADDGMQKKSTMDPPSDTKLIPDDSNEREEL